MSSMNINFRKQSQFELFPKSSPAVYNQHHKDYQLIDLTLSPENIIVLIIILIMSFVLLFSLGVEKGNRISKTELKTVGESLEVNGHRDDVDLLQTENVQMTVRTTDIEPTNDTQAVFEKQIGQIEIPLIEDVPQDVYTIQVASFKQEKNAQREADQLKRFGYDIYVMPKGKHSIVCVGKFTKKREAIAFSKKLKDRYHDCLVRRL